MPYLQDIVCENCNYISWLWTVLFYFIEEAKSILKFLMVYVLQGENYPGK